MTAVAASRQRAGIAARIATFASLASVTPLALPVAAAQSAPATTVELAPGVFAVQMAPSPVSDSNVLLIINDDDVVVVDTNILPASARAVIAELRKLTQKPVRYIVNTHWHSDHHYGNETYLNAFPGAEIIQHANTRRDVIARDVPSFELNVTVEYPAIAARYRKALETGVTSQGVAVTDAMRKSFTEVLEYYELFVRDMGASRIVPGTLTIQDSLVLHRGARTIVIKFLGKGNTAGDLVVYLPNERIVATGDLVVHPIPFAFFSYLGEWPATLRALASLDAATIVPGHGDIQRDWTYVERLIPLIESTWRQVQRAVASGAVSLDSVRTQVDLESFRAAFAGNDAAKRRQFGFLYFDPATEAAFRALKPDSR